MKKMTLSFLIGFAFALTAKAQSNPLIVNHDIKSNYMSQHVGLPLEAMKENLRAKQAAYEKSVSECRSQVVELYNSAGFYPEIKDGKHSVTITGSGFCNETYVIVDKGKVLSIATGNGYITNLTISTPIKDALSKVGFPDSETGVTRYLDVVFLNDILSR